MNKYDKVQVSRVDEINAEMLSEVARLSRSVPLYASPNDVKLGAAPGVAYVPGLLRLDGPAFVNAVFRAVLGRKADPEAMTALLEALAAGADRLEMIKAVRASPEGEAYQSVLIGVPRPSRLRRLYALPLLGRRLKALRARFARRPAREVLALRDRMAVLEEVYGDQIEALTAACNRQKKLLLALDRAVKQLSAAPWSEPLQALAVRQDALEEFRQNLLLEASRQGTIGQVAQASDVGDPLLDPLYVAFENKFRGSRELVKTRQLVHVPVMTEAGAGSATRPIVDVGAGRGEWLELLREHGLAARGIDLNGAMVEACQALGLDCIQGDAVAELARLADQSLGAVTGFHIIEHLPFRAMVALFDEAWRVLAPGGVILFETPNPENLQVGSRYFYLDPTHRNPLPGEMVQMIAEARGFREARIQPLHPMGERFAATDAQLGAQLDALLHGPMDYALIAYKA